MNHFLLPVCYFLSLSLVQGQPCPDYPRLMKAGNRFMDNKEYKLALNKFNAAKLCLPDSSSGVDKRISAVFDAIEKEKQEAIYQRQLAEMAQKKAETAQKKAKAAEEAALYSEASAKKEKISAEASRESARAAEIAASKAKEQAQKDAGEAQSLLWANESDKMSSDTAIRLLERAAQFNLKAVPVYERLFRRFNEGDSLVARKLNLPHKPMSTLGHQGPVYSAIFSGDGSRMLTASEDSTAKLWDAAGQLIATLKHNGPVRSAVFSGDGSRILTASADHTAKLWDEKGKPLLSLVHQGLVRSAVFSGDGSRIVTASTDGKAQFWDIEGRLLATLPHQSAVYSSVFSGDGYRLLSASDDGTAKRWFTAEGALRWLAKSH